MSNINELTAEAKRLRARINGKIWEIEEARSIAASMGGGPEKCKVNGEEMIMDKVKSSHSGDALPRAVIRIIEREEELELLQEEYDIVIKEINKLLEILPPKQFETMHHICIEGMTIRETAAAMYLSRPTVMKYRDLAENALLKGEAS